jgi:hypothetical protein
MVDWSQSLPQIIASIIGSSLIVTALSTINSLIFKPTMDVSVRPYPLISFGQDQNMSYTIVLKNVGVYSSYPSKVNYVLSWCQDHWLYYTSRG